MNYINKKFLNLLSSKLEKFSWINSESAKCRCPYCGDSKKSKKKTRGSFYHDKKTNDFLYHCYNCGLPPVPFGKFIMDMDNELHKHYKFELWKDSIGFTEVKNVDHNLDKLRDVDVSLRPMGELKEILDIEDPEISSPLVLSGLRKMSQLPDNHPAKLYVISRKLEPFMDELYYSSNFPKWGSETFDQLAGWKDVPSHPRLILPCYDQKKNFIGLQARAFGNEQVKYATLKIYKDRDFLFGLDRLDTTKKVFILEGPIDSLMIDNAVAVMSSSLSSVNIFSDYALVYDNQPRNAEIIKLMRAAIKLNKSIVIWPEDFHHKDLNDAICSGMSKSELIDIINGNIYNDLIADLKFNQWRKL